MTKQQETNVRITENFCENGGTNRFASSTASSLSNEERLSLTEHPGSFVIHSAKKKVFVGVPDRKIRSITCETQEGFNELIRSLM